VSRAPGLGLYLTQHYSLYHLISSLPFITMPYPALLARLAYVAHIGLQYPIASIFYPPIIFQVWYFLEPMHYSHEGQ